MSIITEFKLQYVTIYEHTVQAVVYSMLVLANSTDMAMSIQRYFIDSITMFISN